jgi:hypothetical protein
LVAWSSKKQPMVARSNVEVEFRAMTHKVCEMLWLKILLKDFVIP